MPPISKKPITPWLHEIVYLSGPMSRVTDFNHPAFHAAADRLVGLSFTVLNPAENFNGDTTRPYSDYIPVNLRHVTRANAIALLPGWEGSNGVAMELTTAWFLDLPIVDAETLLPVDVSARLKEYWAFMQDVNTTLVAADAIIAREAPKKPLFTKVAFAGYANAGKDAAADALLPHGFTKSSFGDIIKRRVSEMCATELADVIDRTMAEVRDLEVLGAIAEGFYLVNNGIISAYTEDDDEKSRIRTLLERYGEAFYGDIFDEYMTDLPELVVNARLVRCQEAEEWRKQGGIIISVASPTSKAASEWEEDRYMELVAAGHIRFSVFNHGTVEELHAQVRAIVGLE
jgi:hypothetical protein